jgi:SAM-dependent methyltransferase
MRDQLSGTDSYLRDQGALSYLEFINSDDGKVFKQVQGDAIVGRISDNNLSILDAGCGPGWLSNRLTTLGHKVEACDSAPLLIDYAKTHYPNINFVLADLTRDLPYPTESFDVIVLSMAALDLADQKTAFNNLHRVLKPGGKLIVTIVNPYYGYPVGVWKRGIIGFLLRRFPNLRLRPYNFYLRNSNRSFKWSGGRLTSYFYTLPEQLNAFLHARFKLAYIEDMLMDADDTNYSLQYRLYRFPIYLLIELTK